MAEVKVSYDKEGNKLTIWFDKPEKEYTSKEIGDDIVLLKDKSGKVIGIEKQLTIESSSKKLKFSFEAKDTNIETNFILNKGEEQ